MVQKHSWMLLLQVLLWQLFLAKSSTDELLHLADQSSILASYVVTIVGGSAYIQSGDHISAALILLFAHYSVSALLMDGWLAGKIIPNRIRVCYI